MKKQAALLVLGFIFLSTFYSNCSQTAFQAVQEQGLSSTTSAVNNDDGSGSGSTGTTFTVTGSEGNVMQITMGCGYVNQPCVSVTVCQVGSSTACQTIPNLLLDTGSYGLRVFKSALSVGLSQMVNSAGKSIGECVSYVDGTSQWGPVKVADVILGSKRASSVPIQVIDDTFPTGSSGNAATPSGCQDNVDQAFDGYNGILGVGLFTDDCGPNCALYSNNQVYYACSTSACTSTAIPQASQVSNPVSFLSSDNNGVIVQLPDVSSSGAVSLSGWLILGIGTQSDNTPTGAPTYFAADSNGNFQTSFNGNTYTAFIDSGSNGLFFPGPSGLTACPSSSYAYGFFCPSSPVSYSATQIAAAGGTQQSIRFQIANADTFFSQSNPNMVFDNLGGNMSGGFDWGLPFFLGRSVLVGIENKTSSLGTGPYWAY